MALKMTVNGKVDANSKQRNRFLADPERVKKDLESERRITRLQQVREKSNSLARHIRQEVAAEQARQVQNLEQIKQKELDTWREHVMAKKYQDYRTSMFQVGAAHRAAQAETENSEQQKQLRAEKMKKCRRLAAKRAVKHTPANVLRSTGGKELNVEGRATAGTQTPVQTEENGHVGKENRLCNKQACKVSDRQSSFKRKRHTCCQSNGQNDNNDEVELETISDSSTDEHEAQPTANEATGRRLEKTPPVILDVDIESEDSLEICARDGIEINDLYMQTNRKFSRVVRPTPTSASELQKRSAAAPSNSIPSRPRFTQITDLVRRTTIDTEMSLESTQRQPHEQQIHMPRSPTRSLPRSPSKTMTAAAPAGSSNVSPTRTVTEQPIPSSRAPTILPADSRRQSTQLPKRSSLRNNNKESAPAKVIDAGLRCNTELAQPKATVEASTAASTVQPRTAKPIPEPPIHQLPPMQQMPMQQAQMNPLPPFIHPHAVYAPQMMPPYAILPYPMQPYPMQTVCQYAQQPAPPQQPPVTTSTTSTSATPVSTTASHSTVSTTTYVMRQAQRGETNTTGHVQFYDHNNKYRRNYKAPAQAVQVDPQDSMRLNAMDNARIETQLRQLREQELNNLRQVTDQRGQKALQREQVRRDCAELTEKLEALTQQQPQLLPSDANFVPSHRFADLALRREQKMNAAMEEMLLRPAIVTCPEVTVTRHTSPRKAGTHTKSNVVEAINVGDPPSNKADDVVSTGSCCSILLDYVNDQSKQLRTELKSMHADTAKSIKLKSLLQRIEKIRSQLLAELQAGEMNGDHAQQVIDSIRKERANIHRGTARNISQREMELQQKEELLEQRLRQLYKQQQKVSSQQERRKKGDDGPVEIIIKVKSDGTVKHLVPKSKAQDKPTQIVASDQTNKPTPTPTTSSSAPTEGALTAVPSQVAVHNQRQNSIDSNSTSYRELPPVNYKNIKPVDSAPPQPEPLHPMVAHYVQRLLGMSRNSIDQLGASSSEVPTPSESIINNPRNISSGSTVNETLIDNQRVERVQAFIRDNRSFVNELEDTLRNQQKEQRQQQEQEKLDKDHSERSFDQLWNRRWANQQHHQKDQAHVGDTERPTTSSRATTGRRPGPVSLEEVSAKSTARSSANQAPQQVKHNQITITEATTTTRITEKQRQRSVEPPRTSLISQSQVTSEQTATRQMERYAQLTENCTQRIAELTELITKVREEKQRLVEVTLTSASEGERHSTEYFDLPPLHTQEKPQEQVRSRTISDRSDSQDTTPSHSEALPLQKHKPTGASLDSGISISRPITAMGQEPPEVEPISLASSTQSNVPRRGKVPPATIRRYSPQLAAEELAHELSTITEVDTPAQSHIVAATPAPMPFPSFDQYAQELQLDLAHLEKDQSMRLQREFHELIQAIKQRGHGLDYREFPSISAYLHEITTTGTHVHVETDPQSMAPSELLQRLRLQNVSIREFPNRRDYIQHRLAREPPEQRELIDSASLDSSDSFNVEAELRQRRILKASFRRGLEAGELPELEVASSTRRESIPPETSTYAPNESGIEPFSRSPLTIEVQLDMERMNMQRPVSMRQRQRHAEPPNSSVGSMSPEPRHTQRSAGGGLRQTSSGRSADAPQEVSQMGRSLNLREFLTKELLRHRVHGGESSSESTDDSLKSNFLQSVIDSLSPSSPRTPAQGHATNGTNDRQKTSTPVVSFLSEQEKSGSAQSQDTQLFSVESRISAVHYADGTPPVPYEQQTSAGRSSRTPKPTTTNPSSRK
ncbi:uncharacterized protein LOC115770908 [Drosophila novamexicana]|uniref:uncharacterized protein LOC115770908 n=1 Tax=Drosophila novamexicana TaxID=47314 RepID=UPI0011E5E09F|nr:uncharacterized protein LOC115770908 [Drosophila novamexicana]